MTRQCIQTVPPRVPNTSCWFVMQTHGWSTWSHLDYFSQTTEQEKKATWATNTRFPTSGAKHFRQNIFHCETHLIWLHSKQLFQGASHTMGIVSRFDILCSLNQIILDQTNRITNWVESQTNPRDKFRNTKYMNIPTPMIQTSEAFKWQTSWGETVRPGLTFLWKYSNFHGWQAKQTEEEVNEKKQHLYSFVSRESSQDDLSSRTRSFSSACCPSISICSGYLHCG